MHPPAYNLSAFCRVFFATTRPFEFLQSHGTFINGTKLETHKPTKLQDGQEIQFGGLHTKYTVKMSSSASGTMLLIALTTCSMGERNPCNLRQITRHDTSVLESDTIACNHHQVNPKPRWAAAITHGLVTCMAAAACPCRAFHASSCSIAVCRSSSVIQGVTLAGKARQCEKPQVLERGGGNA